MVAVQPQTPAVPHHHRCSAPRSRHRRCSPDRRRSDWGMNRHNRYRSHRRSCCRRYRSPSGRRSQSHRCRQHMLTHSRPRRHNSRIGTARSARRVRRWPGRSAPELSGPAAGVALSCAGATSGKTPSATRTSTESRERNQRTVRPPGEWPIADTVVACFHHCVILPCVQTSKPTSPVRASLVGCTWFWNSPVGGRLPFDQRGGVTAGEDLRLKNGPACSEKRSGMGATR